MQLDDFGGLVGLIVSALVAIAFALRKFQVMWTKDNTSLAHEATNQATETASTNVISLMQGEIQRLATQNTDLAAKVNAFQIENIKLKSQIGELTMEIVLFRNSNTQLKEEIKLLTLKLEEFSKVISQNTRKTDRT